MCFTVVFTEETTDFDTAQSTYIISHLSTELSF